VPLAAGVPAAAGVLVRGAVVRCVRGSVRGACVSPAVVSEVLRARGAGEVGGGVVCDVGASGARRVGSFRALVAVGAFAGLRLGEALGLRWQNIDFEHGFIQVRYQLNHQRGLVELKTGRSRRDVVLIPEVANVLREQKMASRFKADNDFVFTAPDGRGRERRSTSRGIERAVERAGVGPLSFHGLRHTYASILISGLGCDVETASRQLGHANSSITLSIYSHEFDAARNTDELRDKLAAGFGHLLAGRS
jgi:integrase